MSFPRIRTMTIDSHDEDVAIIRIRFINAADGSAEFLTTDVGEHLDINADEDGDCLDVLTDFGIPFTKTTVNDRGQIIGPVGLISERDYRRLIVEVSKLRLDA